ncbi:glycoside hydrolase family 43 protein [Epithele typhae]|uniref:glycoside hydrolase family 43 protein n=1 Tax=Epithele typhae TaxID=378194 RepID=UPI002008C0B3|nr:glycoside hydrolase family 43 protein [Epithele typhae]KAH9940032.1 glycoside hydrolase family 43 protein [Epithele typhae]
MRFRIIASILSYAAFVFAVPNPLPGSSEVVVRDPAIFYNSDSKKYFVFSTDENIKIFTSTSLTGPWTRNGSVLPDCSVIQLAGNCSLWAPDINFVNGQYVLYYSVSSLGSQNSAIGLATSPSMELGTWTDHGAVITSQTGDVYNAIDPNLLVASDGTFHLSFGSYWQCVFQVPLSNVSTPASSTPGTHLVGYDGRQAEGGFTYKPAGSPYYFETFSDGITILPGATTRPAPGDEYKVRVGRGTNPSGPFVDQLGNDITLDVAPPTGPTGTLVLGSHDNVYAPGGQSFFFDPVSGRDVIAYHYVPDDAFGGPSYLGLNFVDFSSGWPVLVD